MGHAGDVLARRFDPMFSDDRQLTILGQRSRRVHVHAHDMHAPVLCRARKTVHALDDTHALDTRMMLRVRMPRLARHAPLQPRRVPNLDAPVVRRRHKERMVGGNGEPGDTVRVGVEMGHERGFDAAVAIISGDEALPRGVPPTDRSFVHARTEIVLELAVVILIDVLEQVADPHFLAVCAVVGQQANKMGWVGERIPYVEIGWRDATRDRTVCRVTNAVEVGDDLPDRSGEHSERMRDGASRTPTAFAFDDPTAGAAFCPSVLPTWSRCGARSANEFVVESTDSVGLLGRS